MHFENRYEDMTLIKQVVLQCCTCLIGLGILRLENNRDDHFFQVCKSTIFFPKDIFYLKIDFFIDHKAYIVWGEKNNRRIVNYLQLIFLLFHMGNRIHRPRSMLEFNCLFMFIFFI